MRAYCHPKNYAALPNTFYRNNGDGTFTDLSAETGVSKYYGKGMGVAFSDYDRDGFMDVFVANDNSPKQLFHNLDGGKFQDASAEAGPDLQKAAAHRGLAFGGMDNDGRLDVVVTVLNGNAKYFHNISQNGNHWILLKLVGVKSNRMGLGARIRVTSEDGFTQYHHATTSTG